MTTTYTDIRAQVDTAVKAGGAELAEGIDVDAITAEIIRAYGLVDIGAHEEDEEPVIAHDVFWALVARHDATQAAAPSVDLASVERAQWLAAMPELRGNGHQLSVRGTGVELTALALDVLADLDEHNDGHFDGASIWIGGLGYAVAR